MLDRSTGRGIVFLLILTVPLVMCSVGKVNNMQQKQQCHCLNGGTCSSNDKYMACNCPPGYIGTKCQTMATEISSINKQAIIDQNYSYFYFQPKQINYYQVSLKICLPQNFNKKLTSLVFLEVQRSSGKLKLQPSIYQTSPITFQGTEDRCQTFYTHFIPIRKKLNEQFQRIIFGVSIKNNSDPAANRWVNFLQRSMTNPEDSLKTNQMLQEQPNGNNISDQPQILSQQIQISCTYELYLVENYWGTFIIILSAITLFVSTGVFLYTMRNKYSYSLSNEDILRMYAVNPEDFVSNQNIKNDLSHFKIIMPIMSYELLVEKQKRAQRKSPKKLSKRKIEINNEVEKIQFEKQEKSQTSQPELCVSHKQITPCEQNDQSIENTCTICLINFQKAEKVRQTPCKHIFHQDCIDSWCQNTLNCPVCRQTLDMLKIEKKRQIRGVVQN